MNVRIVLLAVVSATALAGCMAAARTSDDHIVPGGTSTLAAYTPAVRANGLVFFSGVIGLRPGTRELVPGGIRDETRQALANLQNVMDAAGVGRRDVVKCTVFLADIRDYDAMNEEYGRFFDQAPPARSALGVAGLPLGARVEIECIARER